MNAAHHGLPMADLPGMAGRSYEPAPQPTPAPVIAPRNPLTSMLAPAQGPTPFGARGRHAPADSGRTAAPAGRGRAARSARARSGTRDAATSAAGRGRARCAAAGPSRAAPRVTSPPRVAAASRNTRQRRSPARRCRSATSRARPPRSAPAKHARSRPPRTTAQASGISSAICSGSAEGGVPLTPTPRPRRSSVPRRRRTAGSAPAG